MSILVLNRCWNYKSHIKEQNPTFKILNHFMEECTVPIISFDYFGFVIFNGLNTVKYLSRDDIGDLLLMEWDVSYPT